MLIILVASFAIGIAASVAMLVVADATAVSAGDVEVVKIPNANIHLEPSVDPIPPLLPAPKRPNNGVGSFKLDSEVVFKFVPASNENAEEDELSTRERQLLKEFEDAMDAEDFEAVRRAQRKFFVSVEKGGLGGAVPACLRAKAVEAMGSFGQSSQGKEAVVDLCLYLGDGNEDVNGDAFSQIELALGDSDLGDRARSTFVKDILKTLTNEEQIDSLLTQLNDMRNSRKVETIEDILMNGSEQARKIMLEQLSDYTDEDVTAQTLGKWRAENPDDEGDPEIYGHE